MLVLWKLSKTHNSRFTIIPGGMCHLHIVRMMWLAMSTDSHLLQFFSPLQKCDMMTAAEEAIKDNFAETQNN